MIKNFLKILIEKIKTDLNAKKLEIEKARNIALWNQLETELYAMLSFNHSYLLKLGIEENIRGVSLKDGILTIALPKVELYRDYSAGDARKVCERLNQLLLKFLQYEYTRLGPVNYQFTYPNLMRLQFLSVSDHSVELIAVIKLNT